MQIETTPHDRAVFAIAFPCLPVVLWGYPGAIGVWSPLFYWRSDATINC